MSGMPSVKSFETLYLWVLNISLSLSHIQFEKEVCLISSKNTDFFGSLKIYSLCLDNRLVTFYSTSTPALPLP